MYGLFELFLVDCFDRLFVCTGMSTSVPAQARRSPSANCRTRCSLERTWPQPCHLEALAYHQTTSTLVKLKSCGPPQYGSFPFVGHKENTRTICFNFLKRYKSENMKLKKSIKTCFRISKTCFCYVGAN